MRRRRKPTTYLAFVCLAGCNVITSADAFTIAADCTNDCPDAATSPSVPAGWTLVNVLAGSVACAPDAARTLLENPRAGTAPCTCTCEAPSGNPCEQGTSLEFTIGTFGGGCGGAGNLVPKGCNPVDSWSKNTTGINGTPKAPVTQPCPATAALPAVVSDSTIDVCVASNPAAGQDVNACVIREGTDAPCPPTFERRKVMTDKTKLDDSRSCASCSCTTKATACIDANVTLFTDDACTAGTRRAAFDSMCNAFDSTDFNPKSYWYRATPSPAGCAPPEATVVMTGNVGSKAQTTLCCRP